MMCMAPAGTMSAASTGTAQARESIRRSPEVNLVFNRKTSLQKNEQPFGCPITGHFCPVIQGLNTAASVFKRCEQVSWLRVITPCAFSGFPNGICMALAVTVTGSLRTCTEFPFHPNGHSHRVVSAIFIPIWFGFIILHRPVAVNCHFTRIACASMRDRPLQAQIMIPPQSGGYFSFGHSPNITGDAQVRFELACQPRIGLLATRKRVARIVYA